jgi:hypothetical protein
MWETFFGNVPANEFMYNDEAIEATFLQGGFYAVDLTDGIKMFCLNGMYPFYENFNDH